MREALRILPPSDRRAPTTTVRGWRVQPVSSLSAARTCHAAEPVEALVLPPEAALLDGLGAIANVARWPQPPAVVLLVDDLDGPSVHAALDAGVHELAGVHDADGVELARTLDTATLRRRTEQQRSAEVSRANARADALAAYAAAVSHDLRSPLATLVGLAETIETGLTHPAGMPVEQLLLMAQRAAALGRRSLRFTDDLLDDAEHDARQLVELDLPRLIGEAWQLVDRDGVTLIVEADVPGVHGLPAAVRQVLVNLLANAVRYARAGNGVVVVDTHRAGHVMQLRVHDDGPGVPVGMRRRVFEDGVSDSSTGIGLSTVKRHLGRLGGHAWVGHSERLGGAMVVAALPMPVRPTDDGASDVTAPSTRLSAGPGRVGVRAAQ